MSEKLSTNVIVKGHWETLRTSGATKTNPRDVFSFYAVPALLAAGLVYLKVELKGDALNIIATSLSIFAALLFNLLLLLIDRARRAAIDTETTDHSKKRNSLIRQMYMNISYTILICSVAVVLVVAKILLMGRYPVTVPPVPMPDAVTWAMNILDGLIMFSVGHFMLTLLMILKRTHQLFKQEMPA